MTKTKEKPHMVIVMSNYILGGGISGLICSFYTGWPIISKDIGGQMKFKVDWHLGPRYLHVDKFSTKLLGDLKIKAKKKIIKIGHDFNGAEGKTEAFREAYYLKTRKNGRSAIKSAGSGGKSEFESYDVDIQEIITKLFKACVDRVILHNASSVDTKAKEIILDNGKILKYDQIVSTIPAPIFKKINNLTMPDFKSLKKTFVLTDTLYDLKDKDYVYIAGEEPYHRITKCLEYPGKFILEFVGNDADRYKGSEIERCELTIGQIQDSGLSNVEIEGVTFLGRYAEWKHNILTNDIIRKAIILGADKKIKVCAVDLDGVLCEYPKAWVDYANDQLGTNYNLHELKENIGFNKYRELKLSYRLSGIKAHLSVIPHAKAMMDSLNNKDYIVLILSARPALEYKEVLRDTFILA